MNLDTPTTQEINDDIIASLEATLGQTIPFLPKSFLRIVAKTLAAVFILLYKYAGFMFLQIFVENAFFGDTLINGKVINPLVAWGRLINAGDPVAAVSAELLIEVTVTIQAGNLPAGSQLVNANNGVTYLTLTTILLDAPTKQVTVIAASDQQGGDGSGVIGNLADASEVTFANPLPNVSRVAVVVSTSVTGADGETEEAYRQRVVDQFGKRAQGGAVVDYELWGEEPVSIINLYPYTGAIPGHVDLFSESASQPDGIPTPAQLLEVKAAVEKDILGLASRRPLGTFVNSFPITRVAFGVRVVDLVVAPGDLVQAQSDIDDAVIEFLLGAEPFVDGASLSPRTDRITQAALGGIVQDIVDAFSGTQGGTFLSILGADIALYNLGIGEKAKLDGAVAFT